MKVITCYTADIKSQLTDKGTRQVDDRLMRMTADTCLDALRYCTEVFLSEWGYLSGFPASIKPGVVNRGRAANALIHSTKRHPAKYPQFDRDFPNFPSYTRRAVVADALGKVSSYISNHRNWEKQDPQERGSEPALGLPDRYSLTFYDQERDLCDIDKGIIGLKLYDGKTWGWYCFKISPSDAKYISGIRQTRKMLSPAVEKVKGRYRIRFSFEEERKLVQDDNRLAYRMLAVDLGINAAASWCVMEADGTVHGKGVMRLTCEEDRLNHLINRKRMYQQAGKKPKGIYRMITAANRMLSIETCKRIVETAVLYDVNCIVFEHLDRGKVRGRYKERIHMWRKRDVQSRVELQAHRHGMRISRVCAWGTSKYAFDGSGEVLRGSKARLRTYSLCRFKSDKVYNCDLSAAQNIGARFFLREYAKLDGCPELPCTPQRTYATLLGLVSTLKDKAA